MIPVWIPLAGSIVTLAADVAIVVLFLHYLGKRDRVQASMTKAWAQEAHAISDRCHDTQEAGHKALRELTAVIVQLNGGKGR